MDFSVALRCFCCGATLRLEVFESSGSEVREGALRSACGRAFPVIAGVPRILPDDLGGALVAEHPDFFLRHPELAPAGKPPRDGSALRTLHAFGDEWRRFPELHEAHERIFGWYFEGPRELDWRRLRVLDAGCGMGRWLHLARRAGGNVVGMDVSPAIDVVAARDGGELIQADLRYPPLVPGSFDLVYSLGVLHHLEEPLVGLRALARLVRPGGELRIYVYRSLVDEPWSRRVLLGLATQLRRVAARLPFAGVHALATAIAVVVTLLFLWPRRWLRKGRRGERLTRSLPLVHYADVPFRMLVAEQFDRLVAPIEGRYTREQLAGWVEAIGFELRTILPGLGWRVIGRRPSLATAANQDSSP